MRHDELENINHGVFIDVLIEVSKTRLQSFSRQKDQIDPCVLHSFFDSPLGSLNITTFSNLYWVGLKYRVFQESVPGPTSSGAAYYILKYLSIQKLPQKRSHQSFYLSSSHKKIFILYFDFISNTNICTFSSNFFILNVCT